MDKSVVKHTEPWKVADVLGELYTASIGAKELTEEHKANLRLIDKAPVLLDACKRVAAIIASPTSSDTALAILLRAIDKTEGRR